MDKEKILDYVMETPGNTNRAILRGMLDDDSKSTSNIEIVNVEKESENVYTADKTYTQILEAFKQGKICVAKIHNQTSYDETYDVIPLRVFTGYENAEGQRYYINKDSSGLSVQLNSITITNNGATYISKML